MMGATRGFILNCGTKLDEAHNPWRIEFEAKQIHARSSKLANEEVMRVESDAIDDIVYQCLYGAFKLG